MFGFGGLELLIIVVIVGGLVAVIGGVIAALPVMSRRR